MTRKKLNYQFHNPNSMESAVDYMLSIFIEANKRKAEEAIRKACENAEMKEKHDQYGEQ